MRIILFVHELVMMKRREKAINMGEKNVEKIKLEHLGFLLVLEYVQTNIKKSILNKLLVCPNSTGPIHKQAISYSPFPNTDQQLYHILGNFQMVKKP